jgi:hypothetical protein
MDEPRRAIRNCNLFAYTGLKETQLDELRAKGELFNTYPVYEGGRAKFAYADEVACWQKWRDARREGKTKLTWAEWFAKHYPDQEGE